MSTLSKVLLGAVALVATLFAALVVFVTVVVDPNDYRPYIVNTVTVNTGRPLELTGDLGLKLWPCCSISVAGASLGNPPGFEADVPEDQAFAHVDEAAFSLKLWPLLVRRDVIVGTVTLDGLRLDLIRLADGRANWEFTEPAADAAPAEPGTGLTSLRVDGVRVRDGSLRYRDLGAAHDFEVSGIRIDTDTVEYAESAVITSPQLALTVTGTGLPDGGVRASVRADRVAADLGEALAVHLDTLRVELAAAGAELSLAGDGFYSDADAALAGTFTLDPGSPRDLLTALMAEPYRPADGRALTRLAGRGEWALTSSALAVTGVQVTLDDSTLTGSAGIDDFAQGALSFDLALDRIDLDRYLPEPAGAASAPSSEPTSVPLDALADVMLNGRLRIGRLRASGVDVNDLALALNAANGQVDLRADGRAGNGTFALAGAGRVSGRSPALAGTLQVDGVSPRTLLDALDATPETSDPNVLARLSGSSRWRLEPTALALEAMAWQLDDTKLEGSLLVAGFDRPGVRFQLDVDRLDVDAYLPPAAADAPEGSAEAEIPVELIRTLDIGGRLRAQTLIVSGLTLSNVSADVAAANGVLRLDPVQAGLYGGEYRGNVVIDATGPKANLTLEQALTAVRVAEVLEIWFDSDLLDGALSLTLNGTGSGNTFTELLRGVGADVAMSLSDGVYRGADLLYELRRAQALLRSEAAPPEPDSKETPIRALTASGRLIDGVLRSDRISAENSYLKLLGRGGLNLVDMALDYRFDAELLRAVEEGSGSRLTDLIGNTVPLTLSGPLTSPRVGVDLQGLITGRLRDTVQERAVDALLDRIAPRPKPAPEAPAAEAPPPGEAPIDEAPADETSADETPEAEPPREREPSPRDLLRRGLRDLIAPPEPARDEGL
jgi:AsmA protein